MKILDDLSLIEPFDFPIVTSGTFDGVHFGHQKILKRITDIAKAEGGESVVLTYWPHPRFVIEGGWGDLKLLTTFEEKSRLLEQTGIDYLIKIPFTREFSELNSQEFIDEVLINKINTKKLVIGYDHRFGRNREGGFDYLKQNQVKFGFSVEEIPRQEIDDVGVSSTKIRKAIEHGDISEANSFLGREYSISGLVTKGDQLGRKIGFPTANIYVPENYKLIPSDGVYVVFVSLNGASYSGMLNIGKRPTIGGVERRIEVNLFDFNQEIYGQRLEIKFVTLLRKERKFNDIYELANQLNEDRDSAKIILQKRT